MVAVANADVKGWRSGQVIVFRQHQMQTTLVFNDGADLIRKHRQRFAGKFRAGQNVAGCHGLRFLSPTPVTDGEGEKDADSRQPGGPGRTREKTPCRAGRSWVMPESVGNPPRKHFQGFLGNFRQPRLFQKGFEFRIIHGAGLSRIV